MIAPPEHIGGDRVIARVTLNADTSSTGKCRHVIANEIMRKPSGLAIVQYVERGQTYFLLFYCDEAWTPMADSWHLKLDDAIAQAQFEFIGLEGQWTMVDVSE